MPVFKFVIAEKGKCYQIEKDQKDCETIIGLKIKNTFSGDIIGLEGYELQITGGTDKDGFPMKPDVQGAVKKGMLLKKSTGFSGRKKRRKKLVKIKGLRRRKTVRGNTIDSSITQINCRVVKTGNKGLDELIGKKEKTVKEEKKPEEKRG